jgi:hypothetical protein
MDGGWGVCMNREQRRTNERVKTQSDVAKITLDEYKKKIAQSRHEATKEAIKVMTAIMAISLNNEFDFGTKRIQKLIDRMSNQFACILDGTVSVEDILDWCKENNIKVE